RRGPRGESQVIWRSLRCRTGGTLYMQMTDERTRPSRDATPSRDTEQRAEPEKRTDEQAAAGQGGVVVPVLTGGDSTPDTGDHGDSAPAGDHGDSSPDTGDHGDNAPAADDLGAGAPVAGPAGHDVPNAPGEPP